MVANFDIFLKAAYLSREELGEIFRALGIELRVFLHAHSLCCV